MRVTFLLPCHAGGPSGGFRVVYEFANGLAARGHDVSVVHVRRAPDWTPDWADLSLLICPPYRPPTLGPYRRLRRKVRDFLYAFFFPRYLAPPSTAWLPTDQRVRLLSVPRLAERYIPDGDAIFAVVWPSARTVLRYPHIKGKKFYLVMDLYPWTGRKEAIEASWRLPLAKVAISDWLNRQVRDAGNQDVVTIRCGLDHLPLGLNRPIGERPPIVAMMYFPLAYKAPDDGLEALRIVKARYPDLQALVFGPLSPPPALPAWVTYSQNLPDQELVDLYNKARVFACSSVAEGFGLPGAEAMACGCALATTDCGGSREYAEHGVTALVSPPRNPAALAENVLQLLTDDGLRMRLAEAGYRRARLLTWERAGAALETFLKARVHPGQ